MSSADSAGLTEKGREVFKNGAAAKPLPAPAGAAPSASGKEPSTAPGSPSSAPPAGAEVRTKEWAGRIRRYYGEVFCSAVNHPADPRRFPALRQELRQGRKAEEDVLSVRVRDDPDHPATRVARAISEVVLGEEDQDREAYEAGARYLLVLIGTYPIVVDPSLHLGCPTPSAPAPDAPAGEGGLGGRSQPQGFPTVRLGFEDTRWVRLELALAVSRDAPWNSTAWLLQEFVRYELFYKGRLLRLGVCHNPMCQRLYVKAKHAGSIQSFCNRACGDAARRQRQAP